MRKHFLILMLLALLPFTAWAIEWTNTPAVKTNLVYTGQPQELFQTAPTHGSDIYYLVLPVSDDDPTAEQINGNTHEATDAGSYKIWVKVGDEITNFPVTIAQKPMDYTAFNIEKKYGETDNSALTPADYELDENDLVTGESLTDIGNINVVRVDEGENAGSTYRYKLVADGNYKLRSNTYANIEIKKNNISAVTVTLLNEGSGYTYTGSVINPTVANVKVGDFVVPTSNYSVTYGNTNTNVTGTHKVIITAQGDNFNAGHLDREFNILKKDITAFTLTLSASEANFINDETPVTYPTVVSVTSNGYNLTSADYENYKIYSNEECTSEVTAANLIAKGTYYAKVDGKTNFSGSAKATFKIKGTSLDNVIVTVDNVAVSGTEATGNWVYAGGELVQPVVNSVKKDANTTLVSGTDYEVSYENNINATPANATDAQKARIVITGKGDYLNNSKTIYFSIAPKDLSTTGIDVTGIAASYEFNGKEQKPAVSTANVTYTVGANVHNVDIKLDSNDEVYDASVSYGTNNTNATPANPTDAQKASVIITAKAGGNYTGSKTVYFTISRKSIADLTYATDLTTAKAYQGVKIEPTTFEKITWNNGALVKLAANTDYIVTYGDATHDNKTVSATANDADKTGLITITGTGNYAGTKVLKFQITKVNLTIKAKNCQKTIGSADPQYILEYTGLVGNDIKEGTGVNNVPAEPATGVLNGITVTRTPGEDAGVKALTVNTAAATGTAVTNYNLIPDNNGTLTIAASTTPLVLKVKNPDAETYGTLNFNIASMNANKAANLEVVSGYIGEVDAQGQPINAAATLSALLNLDNVTFGYQDNTIQTNPTNAGSYVIKATGTATSNSYTNVQIQNGTYTINPFVVKLKAKAPTAVAFADGESEYVTPTAAQIAADGWDAGNAWVEVYNVVGEVETLITSSQMPQVSAAAEFWKKDFIKSIAWDHGSEAATLGNPGQIVITLNDQFVEGNENFNTNYTVTAVAANVTFTGIPALVEFDTKAASATANSDKIDQYANVTPTTGVKILNRTLKGGEWNALVLPFDIKPFDFCTRINGYAVFDVLQTSGDAMNFKITIDEIPAYTPFLVKTDADVTMDDVTFLGVRILDVDENNLVQMNNKYKFIGTIDFTTYEAPIWYFYTDASKPGSLNLDLSKVAMKIPGFTAYITSKNGEVVATPQITIEEADGSTTAITSINADGVAVKAEGWYTVNGVKLQGAPTEKGIYINNGKKVVVK